MTCSGGVGAADDVGGGKRCDSLHQLPLLQLLQTRKRQRITRISLQQQGQVVDAHDALLLEGHCDGSTRAEHADFECNEGVGERGRGRGSC